MAVVPRATPPPRPRAVLFDLFHTLVSVPAPGGAHGPSVAEALGIPHAHAELSRLYYDEDVLDRCRGKVRVPLEILRALAHRLDPTVSEERLAVALESRRRRFAHGLVEVEPATLAALDRLRAAGVRTALVSDAGYDDVEAWERSPLRGRLDATVFSYEVGVRKPDPRIFHRALSALGASPAEALFVGDGGSDELRGARAVGMGAVFVSRFLSRAAPERIEASRLHADWEFEDVPALVAALLPGPAPGTGGRD
jgi:putative hydrolase of the HAD superfamily